MAAGKDRRSRRVSDVETDWRTTAVAAFSFFVHFGGVAVLYSDWGDRVVPLEGDVTGLVEQVGMPSGVPSVEENASQGSATEGAAAATVVKTAPASASATVSTRDAKKHTAELLDEVPPSAGGFLDSRTAPSLTTEVDPWSPRIELATIGVQTTTDPRGGRVYEDSDQLLTSLGAFARSPTGSGPPAPIRAWSTWWNQFIIMGEPFLSTGPRSPPAAMALGPPKNSVSIGGPPKATDGVIPGVEGVIRGAQGSVRACFQDTLASDPGMEGRVSYTVKVDASGRVIDVSTSPSGSLSAGFVACVQGVLRALTFERPTRAPTSISGSYSFVNTPKALP